MITKIKGYLKTLCASVTGISEEDIITDLTEELGDLLPPYVVILSGDGSITPVFERDQSSRFRDRGREVYRKYDVSLPVEVAFGADDEEGANAFRDDFLHRLGMRLVSGDSFIQIRPETLRQTDSESTIREHFAASVLVQCDFSTYLTPEELKTMSVLLS